MSRPGVAATPIRQPLAGHGCHGDLCRPPGNTVYSYGHRVRAPSVRFRIVRTRQRGVALAPRDLGREPGFVGELLVWERHDDLLRRSTRIATLVEGVRPGENEVLPPLFDATLVWMAPQGLVISGIERLRVGRRPELAEFAQAWWCREP